MDSGKFDPTKGPYFGGFVGLDGKFYPPDPALQQRQKDHFRHEVYSGLDYMLGDVIIKLNGEPASSLDRIEQAAELLGTFRDDSETIALAQRVAAFCSLAQEKGETDPVVREQAQQLKDELTPYAEFNFWAED